MGHSSVHRGTHIGLYNIDFIQTSHVESLIAPLCSKMHRDMGEVDLQFGLFGYSGQLYPTFQQIRVLILYMVHTKKLINIIKCENVNFEVKMKYFGSI